MIFNSYPFIFGFLPITLVVFFLIRNKVSVKLSFVYLFFASLFFYSWWNPIFVILMIASIVVNFFFSGILIDQSADNSKLELKAILVVGILFNLLLIGYFKYFNFFINNINYIFGYGLQFEEVVLPLAISFFTFQQIAYLIDSYRGVAKKINFFQYGLFVSFFPQLIAGPIVHHKEMIPQLLKKTSGRFSYKNFAVGLTFFSIGLFKKVVIADKLGVSVDRVFNAVDSGSVISFFEAWSGALLYTFQIYFDFSGYSDMAIGLGLLLGLKLPINFNSPYKSRNIVEFWRRWHITLSRFFRLYLYFPLGGNRKGRFIQSINIMIVMLIGGLWHGAGWTFVIWGGLHGFYIIVCHSWTRIVKALKLTSVKFLPISQALSTVLTFVAVVFAWIVFRSNSFESAFNMWQSMLGLNGVILPSDRKSWMLLKPILVPFGVSFEAIYHTFLLRTWDLKWLVLSFFVAFGLPNTQQLVRKAKLIDENNTPKSIRLLSWSPNFIWVGFIAVILTWSTLQLSKASAFLYFQF